MLLTPACRGIRLVQGKATCLNNLVSTSAFFLPQETSSYDQYMQSYAKEPNAPMRQNNASGDTSSSSVRKNLLTPNAS